MLPLTALIRAGLSDGMRSNSEPLAKSSYERIGEQANEIERQAGSRKKKYHVFCSRRMLEVGLSVFHFHIFLLKTSLLLGESTSRIRTKTYIKYIISKRFFCTFESKDLTRWKRLWKVRYASREKSQRKS